MKSFAPGTPASVLTWYGFRHYFIVGQERTAYHNDFRGEPGFRCSPIEDAYLHSVLGSDREEQRHYPKAEVLRRAVALAALQERRYNLLFNNCEDSTRDVAEGWSHCEQFEQVAALASLGTGPLAPAAFVAALGGRQLLQSLAAAPDFLGSLKAASLFSPALSTALRGSQQLVQAAMSLFCDDA